MKILAELEKHIFDLDLKVRISCSWIQMSLSVSASASASASASVRDSVCDSLLISYSRSRRTALRSLKSNLLIPLSIEFQFS